MSYFCFFVFVCRRVHVLFLFFLCLFVGGFMSSFCFFVFVCRRVHVLFTEPTYKQTQKNRKKT
jgi:hypothetical protein